VFQHDVSIGSSQKETLCTSSINNRAKQKAARPVP